MDPNVQHQYQFIYLFVIYLNMQSVLQFYTVLTMVYSTQTRRLFGLFLSHILKENIYVLWTGMVPAFRITSSKTPITKWWLCTQQL